MNLSQNAVVHGLLSPRPCSNTDDMQPYFESFQFGTGDRDNDLDKDLDFGIIERSDSGGAKPVSRKRRRAEGSTDSDAKVKQHGNQYSHRDYFLHDINEQIPHLQEVPVSSRRKRHTSNSSTTDNSVSNSTSTSIDNSSSISTTTKIDENVITARPISSLSEPSMKVPRNVKSQHQAGPKRPRTAYIIFLDHFRQSYYEKFPNSSFNDCQKFAGKKWRSLSEVEKLPWKERERLSQKDFIHKMHGLQSSFGLVKERGDVPSLRASSDQQHALDCQQSQYQLQHNGAAPQIQQQSQKNNQQNSHVLGTIDTDSNNNGNPSIGGIPQGTSEPFFSEQGFDSITSHQNQMKLILNATHSTKAMELVKGPKNAFSLYVQAMRAECQKKEPNLTYNEIQKRLSVEWRQMPHSEKAVWIEKSNEIKRQLSEYNEEMAAKGLDASLPKKGDMRRVKKGIALPKGPRSAYTLFYQCARKQLHEIRPELSFQEYPTICSKIWRDMPENEKALWKNDSANDKIRYEQELLALARSDVANTATSIVMEEKMNAMQGRLKPLEFQNLLAAAHATASASRSSSSLSSSSSDMILSNNNNSFVGHEIENCHGKTTTKENESDVSPSNNMKSNCVRKIRASTETTLESNISTNGDNCHVNASERPSMLGKERSISSGRLNFSDSFSNKSSRPHVHIHGDEAWMDVDSQARRDHANNGFDDISIAEGALSAYSRDSNDRGNSPPPMVGLGKYNQVIKSPSSNCVARDFVAAGMTSKVDDIDDEMKSLSSISPHASADKESQHHVRPLYNDDINHHLSDSNDIGDHEAHGLMPFEVFDGFSQI